ncbi:MAG: carboxylating nicotinate-nucleotide diphosphorylase [Coleofasciculaceae cyanobacterium SM2_1_6]|nr:carboxylating nicotinate-nucleotide diphosphorylase [Coleofasciculaceae cyanobacterium SM2_1_6]
MHQIERYKAIIHQALEEDIGTGDITSMATIPADLSCQGEFIAKAEGVIAGIEVVQWVFELVDPQIKFIPQVLDGATVKNREVIGLASGSGLALLQAERVALNFLQRMSGIATLTQKFVGTVAGTRAVILDTRKTAPGLRLFDKWAVHLGGGQNHRFGLDDMALIKDNHITAAGGITAAVTRMRSYLDRASQQVNPQVNPQNQEALVSSKIPAQIPTKIPIEVEVKNLAELQEALTLGVDRIMLDNMSLEAMRQAVEITQGAVPLEASGNVNLHTVGAIAKTGVDYISIGHLTHSVTALDISFCL